MFSENVEYLGRSVQLVLGSARWKDCPNSAWRLMGLRPYINVYTNAYLTQLLTQMLTQMYTQIKQHPDSELTQ